MDCPTSCFNLFDLPLELRQMVYSYIILPPHKQILRSRTSRHNFRYYQQRRDLHETAKSLLRVSRDVHQEALPLFCRHKTFLLAKSSEAFHTLAGVDTISNQILSATVKNVNHIRFDLKLSPADIKNMFINLRHDLVVINNILKSHMRHLPHLQTVTFKLAQSRFDVDLGIEKSTFRTPLATCHPGGTSWEYGRNWDNELIDSVLEDGSYFYQYADGLSSNELSRRKWACTKHVSKSKWWDPNECLVHELVFQKRGKGIVHSKLEEDAWSDVSEDESMGEEEDEYEDIDMEEGIMQGFIDDYYDVSMSESSGSVDEMDGVVDQEDEDAMEE